MSLPSFLVPIPLPGTAGPFLATRPQPKKGTGPYTFPMLEALWIRHGGPRNVAPVAAAISLAESGGNPHAVNSIGATGLWQIHPGAARYLNPDVNAAAAVAKYKAAGNKFTPWTTYTGADTPGHKKTYLDFLPKGMGLPGSAIPGIQPGYDAAAQAGDSVHFLAQVSKALFDPAWWLRVGLIFLGLAAFLMGVYFIGREFVTKQAGGIVQSAVGKG